MDGNVSSRGKCHPINECVKINATHYLVPYASSQVLVRNRTGREAQVAVDRQVERAAEVLIGT